MLPLCQALFCDDNSRVNKAEKAPPTKELGLRAREDLK